MDISKEYIQMCEKAFGDIGFANDTIYCLYDEAIYRVMAEEITEERGTGYKQGHFLLRFFEFNELEQDKEIYKWIDSEEIIPIYSQDQLQEIVNFKLQSMDRFIGFCITGIHRCNSMEQLWLDFVMQEKYQKHWDGKDWVKNNE